MDKDFQNQIEIWENAGKRARSKENKDLTAQPPLFTIPQIRSNEGKQNHEDVSIQLLKAWFARCNSATATDSYKDVLATLFDIATEMFRHISKD